jgi:RNase P subunit RPR2
MAEAYCMKCKAKKEMAETKEVQMKNGRPALEGKCPSCGTKMFKILSTKK